MHDYFGWMGKILHIDLTTGKMDREPIDSFMYQYLGGRGFAARKAWDLLKKGKTAFSPETPIIIMTGPLTGTSAPYSGRTTLCSLAPQGFPVEWYTRSSFGGHWGPELKYAGWDGIIITGKAEEPVYIMIEDDEVRMLNARSLWGKGIFETQKLIRKRHDAKTKVFAIGQSGENLCRISIAATETESASGQGGFGASFGAKNLKAIAVKGSKSIKIADPKRFNEMCSLIRKECHASHGWPHPIKLDAEKVKKYGQRFQACTQQCHTGCFDARFYTRVPGTICKKMLKGQIDCVAGLFPGIANSFYDWDIGFEAGFEMAQLTNDLGINHWEILIGLMPWLRDCHAKGYLKEINGRKFDIHNVYTWNEVIRAITFRQGPFGDAFAEGTVRGAQKLRIGEGLLIDYFPCWGYAGHWDGHGDHINHIVYPFWIVAALQWAMDTRDPISSGHGYTQNIMNWSQINSPEYGIPWNDIMAIGEHLYGSSKASDPRSDYEWKAEPAIWHNHRSVFKDSLPVDDQMFPRIYSNYTEDHYSRVGDLEGIDFEYHMFTTATGSCLSREEFNLCAERIVNLDRMINIRLFDRSRDDDETLLSYYEKPENSVNPYRGEPMSLDVGKFKLLMDHYYALRNWDIKTGKPGAEKLHELDLGFTLEKLC